jgi:hypothetical protein
LGRFFPRLTESNWANLVVAMASDLFVMVGALAQFRPPGEIWFPASLYPYSRTLKIPQIQAFGLLAHELTHYDQYLHDPEGYNRAYRRTDPDLELKARFEEEADFNRAQVVAYFSQNPPGSCVTPTN